MPRCYLLAATPENLQGRAPAPEHTQEIHFGYVCEVDAEGRLIADIPEALLQAELDAGRAVLVVPAGDAVATSRGVQALQAGSGTGTVVLP